MNVNAYRLRPCWGSTCWSHPTRRILSVMGRVYQTVVALCVMMLSGSAAPLASHGRTHGLQTPVDVTTKAADVLGVLQWLSKKGQVNIVATPNVRGTVTLHLRQVTVADALRAVVSTGGWSMERTDNVIMVMTRDERLRRIHDARRRR